MSWKRQVGSRTEFAALSIIHIVSASLSYTEWEFDLAAAAGLPRPVFLFDEEADVRLSPFDAESASLQPRSGLAPRSSVSSGGSAHPTSSSCSSSSPRPRRSNAGGTTDTCRRPGQAREARPLLTEKPVVTYTH
jgi:hypothetical protein